MYLCSHSRLLRWSLSSILVLLLENMKSIASSILPDALSQAILIFLPPPAYTAFSSVCVFVVQKDRKSVV